MQSEPYSINLIQDGRVEKTIVNLTKAQAKACFYLHYDKVDCYPQVVLAGLPMTIGRAMKHFGKRRQAPFNL